MSGRSAGWRPAVPTLHHAMQPTLRTRSLRVAALVALPLALTLGAWSSAAPTVRTAATVDDSPLGEQMETLKRSMRRLRAQVEGQDRAATLETLAEMQSAVLTAKGEVPAKAADVEQDREEFVAAYRAKMAEVLIVLCKMEIAAAKNEFREVNDLMQNELRPMEKAGHREFRKDDDH